VVHTLSHSFRSATSIVRTSLKLPIEPHHVLVKVIYAGVNASDVSFLIPTSCSGRYFGGSDQELFSRLPFDAGFEGFETRVNAQADAYEYMVDYSRLIKGGRIGECCGLVSFVIRDMGVGYPDLSEGYKPPVNCLSIGLFL
ncbi:hypothetical protein IFM89_011621, partial [Coptis chinensis]